MRVGESVERGGSAAERFDYLYSDDELAEFRAHATIWRRYVEATLEALTESMHADVLKAQAEVARLEARTWAGVLVAFGAATSVRCSATGSASRGHG